MAARNRVPKGWNRVKISKIAEVIGGGTPSTKKLNYWGGNIPWVVPSDITRLNGRYIDRTERYITKEGLKDSGAKILPEKSLLVTSRATIAECAINLVPMATNQGFASLLFKDSVVPEYIYYLIKHNKDELSRLASGSTFLELSKRNFHDFDVLIPTLYEQKKIAKILGSVDDVIECTRVVIEQTEQTKKGLIKQTASYGLPRTHIKTKQIKPIGAIPEIWSVARLGELTDKITSGSRGWADYYADEGKLFLRITNLTRKSISPDLSNNRYVIPPRGAEGTRTKVKSGDILISITADLGIIGYIPNEFPEAYVNQHIALARLKEGSANPHWVALFLASHMGQEQFRRFNDPGAKAGLNLESIRQLTVALPPIEEQNKIVSLVDDLERRISAEYAALDALMTLKKALMQALLTGKKRVPLTKSTKPTKVAI